MATKLDEWAADCVALGSEIKIQGELVLVCLAALGLLKPPARQYAEILDGDRLWRVFCDLRQFGMPEATYRAVTGRKGVAPTRLVVSTREYLEAKQKGVGPAMPYCLVSIRPTVAELPCTVEPGFLGTPTAGHRVLVVKRGYRWKLEDGAIEAASRVIDELDRSTAAEEAKHGGSR